MHSFDRQTDGQTDGQTDKQTEISSLDRVCIACSAVKTIKIALRTGTTRDFAGGAYSAPSYPIAGFRGGALRGGKRERKETESERAGSRREGGRLAL